MSTINHGSEIEWDVLEEAGRVVRAGYSLRGRHTKKCLEQLCSKGLRKCLVNLALNMAIQSDRQKTKWLN